jgi:hypothetical protein
MLTRFGVVSYGKNTGGCMVRDFLAETVPEPVLCKIRKCGLTICKQNYGDGTDGCMVCNFLAEMAPGPILRKIGKDGD